MTTERTLTYETEADINNEVLYDWEDVVIKDLDSIRTDDFRFEKDLEGWIVTNIELFCKDILKDEMVSFETNYCVKPRKGRTLMPNQRRADIYIKGNKRTYIIELKKPRYLRENTVAIGQLLNYGRELKEKNPELIIITTMFDISTAKTIKYYGLPIRYIYISKNKMLEYKGEGVG